MKTERDLLTEGRKGGSSMKQVMYGIKIVDVNDFGGWIGYEPVKQELADVLNHHLYLFFQNEYHIRQFAEGRKFVINVNDEDFQKVIGNARILKAVVEIGTQSAPRHTPATSSNR